MTLRPHMINGRDMDYLPPRGNVLLLSCMDARLISELALFMDSDNLTNRYDHVILAGAALGALQNTLPYWGETFFHHLGLAIELHNVADVYIVEHRNCGAYRKFLGLDYGDTTAEQARERRDHAEWAFRLRDAILDWTRARGKEEGTPVELNVRCFLMDLRGHVTLLREEEAARKKVAAKKAR